MNHGQPSLVAYYSVETCVHVASSSPTVDQFLQSLKALSQVDPMRLGNSSRQELLDVGCVASSRAWHGTAMALVNTSHMQRPQSHGQCEHLCAMAREIL